MEAGHDLDFRPDVSLCGGGEVAGPGWTLEAIPTPGHTSNHLCYALTEENACFTGDHIMGWSTTVITPPDGDMGDYLASLRAHPGARLRDALADPRPADHARSRPFIDAYAAHRLERDATRSCWRSPPASDDRRAGARGSTPASTRASSPPPPARCWRT